MMRNVTLLAAMTLAATAAEAAPVAKQTVLPGVAVPSVVQRVDDVTADGAPTVRRTDGSLNLVRRFGAQGLLAEGRVEVTMSGALNTELLATRASSNRALAEGGARLGQQRITGPGFQLGFNEVVGGASCSTTIARVGCTASGQTFFSQTVSSVISDLSPYYAGGFGNVAAEQSGEMQSTLFLSGLGSGRSAVTPVTTFGSRVTYTYYDFSDAAFGDGAQSLTLDFGTVTIGDPLASLDFSLLNRGLAGSARLDLDSLAFAGDDGFSTTLAPFKGQIDGGASERFAASFNPTTAGRFSGTYTLRMSDEDLGIGARDRTLTLNLLANVTSVPEPATWMTMLAGFAAVGGALRRRREPSFARQRVKK